MKNKQNKDTAEIVFQSAVECILKKGYSKTTLEDIVHNVGLTRGAFYWNYNSKVEILEEIIRRYKDFYIEIYSNYEIHDSARETIKALLVKNLWKKSQKNPYFLIVRYQIEVGSVYKSLPEIQENLDNSFNLIIKKEIKRGIEQGEFSNDLDLDNVAKVIYMFLLGAESYFSVHTFENNTKEEILSAIDNQVEIILSVLK